MSKFVYIVIVISLSLTATVQLVAEESTDFSDSTRSTIDSVVTWGAGIAGGSSLLLCTNKKKVSSNPASFYMFNGAAVSYWAMDLLISDEDKDASEEIAAAQYGGSNDEQMNSYLRSRDLALANEDAAKKKGLYKQAASVVMLGAAAMSLYEDSKRESEIKAADAKTAAKCSSSSEDQGVAASAAFGESRCKKIGSYNVACSKGDVAKIERDRANCVKVAKTIATSSVACAEVVRSGSAALKKSEKGGVFDSEFSGTTESGVDGKKNPADPTADAIAKFNNMSDSSAKEADDSAKSGGSLAKIDHSTNPVVKALTMFGYQYSAGDRAIAYGVLGAVIGVNAFANNSSAIEYGNEADYYQGLVDGMTDCGDNCLSSGAGGVDSGTTSGGGSSTSGDPSGSYAHSETYSLNSMSGNNKKYTWLGHTGSHYGSNPKFVFEGCGELVVPNGSVTHGADGNTSNHNQAFYFCGTDFSPGEAEYNGGLASIFTPPGCQASNVTVYYN